MLRRIPTITPRHETWYFDSIDSKLSVYESVKDLPMLLELAIWKVKITDQNDCFNTTFTIGTKMRCRTDTITMVTIIVPNVLSFLTDGNDCDDTFDSNDEDSDNNHWGNDESESSNEEDIGDESSNEEDNDVDDEQDDHNDEDEDGHGEGNRRQGRRLG
jgi:hypothetical protein